MGRLWRSINIRGLPVCPLRFKEEHAVQVFALFSPVDGGFGPVGSHRIFEVRLQQDLMPHVAPPPRPRGRILPLRKIGSIKEAILARPTFFEHFDGVLIDWRYLHDRQLASLVQEAGWIGRQKLRVACPSVEWNSFR
jgi:hypothetical protein